MNHQVHPWSLTCFTFNMLHLNISNALEVLQIPYLETTHPFFRWNHGANFGVFSCKIRVGLLESQSHLFDGPLGLPELFVFHQLHMATWSFCLGGPKHPDPSAMAVLRTSTPLLYKTGSFTLRLEGPIHENIWKELNYQILWRWFLSRKHWPVRIFTCLGAAGECATRIHDLQVRGPWRKKQQQNLGAWKGAEVAQRVRRYAGPYWGVLLVFSKWYLVNGLFHPYVSRL